MKVIWMLIRVKMVNISLLYKVDSIKVIWMLEW